MTDPQKLPGSATLERPERPGISIGRFQGTVVVTVHGELNPSGAAQLGRMLGDLIDGQGNLSLIVDLHHATAGTTDADHVSVFAYAARRARRRGGLMTLSEPPVALRSALRRRGLDHLVGASVHGGSVASDRSPEAALRRERCAHPAARCPAPHHLVGQADQPERSQ